MARPFAFVPDRLSRRNYASASLPVRILQPSHEAEREAEEISRRELRSEVRPSERRQEWLQQPTSDTPFSLTGDGGEPLQEEQRRFFEARLGHSFQAVRVHTDDAADALSHQLHARAFTFGHDIYFRSGHYAPASRSGQELLAHELAHTLQIGESAIKRQVEPADEIGRRNVEFKFHRGLPDLAGELSEDFGRLIQAVISDTLLTPGSIVLTGIAYNDWDGKKGLNALAQNRAQNVFNDIINNVTAAAPGKVAAVTAMFPPFGAQIRRRRAPTPALAGPVGIKADKSRSVEERVVGVVMRVPRYLMRQKERLTDKSVPTIGR